MDLGNVSERVDGIASSDPGVHKPRLSPITRLLIGIASAARLKMILKSTGTAQILTDRMREWRTGFWIVQSNTVSNFRFEIAVAIRDFDNCMHRREEKRCQPTFVLINVTAVGVRVKLPVCIAFRITGGLLSTAAILANIQVM